MGCSGQLKYFCIKILYLPLIPKNIFYCCHRPFLLRAKLRALRISVREFRIIFGLQWISFYHFAIQLWISVDDLYRRTSSIQLPLNLSIYVPSICNGFLLILANKSRCCTAISFILELDGLYVNKKANPCIFIWRSGSISWFLEISWIFTALSKMYSGYFSYLVHCHSCFWYEELFWCTNSFCSYHLFSIVSIFQYLLGRQKPLCTVSINGLSFTVSGINFSCIVLLMAH